MDIIEVINKYGAGKNELKFGEEVLVEGSDSEGGTFAQLYKVDSISNGQAVLQAGTKFYLRGGESRAFRDTMNTPLDGFKEPFLERLKQNMEFVKWLANRMKSDEEKYDKK